MSRQPVPPIATKLSRGLAGVAVLAVVVGSLGLITISAEPYGSAVGEMPPTTVAVLPARRHQSYEIVQEYLGVVEARRESRVGFELPGELAQVSVDEGALVEKGQVIARLNTEILEAERDGLVAARAEAEAVLRLAEGTLLRQERLLPSKATSRQDWEEAKEDRNSAAAAVDRARAAIAAIDTRIRRAVLRAPFAAVVAQRFVDEGQVVSAGEPIVHLLERDQPEVRIGITGHAVDDFTLGEKHNVVVRGRSIVATVKAVLPLRDPKTRSVDVILTLDIEFNGIRRGDLATLALRRLVDEPGFWLPLSALTESSRGLWSCYVAEGLGGTAHPSSATHRLRKRQIEVLHVETDRVYVEGTLNDGELVVTQGVHRLVQDQHVRTTDDKSDNGEVQR